MSLQVTLRPPTFKDVVGNADTIESLESVLKRPNPPSAFLFTGPAGCGKTTFGRITGHVLGCSDVDFSEINAADDTGIDHIRLMRSNLKHAPLSGEKKVVMFDEAHMLSNASQEALLKILEEPPSYVHIMICTTNPEKLKPTFKRRCHQYTLSLLNPAEISLLIKKALFSEKKDIKKFPRSVVEMIIELCEGSAGQALKMLDMVIDMHNRDMMISTLKSVNMTVNSPEIIDICRVLINRDINKATKWMKLSALIKDLKSDGENARRPILGYMEKVLLGAPFEEGEYIAKVMSNFTSNYYDCGRSGLAISCYLSCMEE